MARARSLAEFKKSFPDEESCAAFLFKQRWPDGFVCPGCGKRRVVGLKSRPRLHECLDCGRQTSVTAGTTMHRSKLPLTTWFWAAHLMATHSNGMSARQLEDQLGVTDKTAWLLTQKLRRSMVDPNREPLEGVVEVDQAEIPFREGDAFFEPGNAGKILVIGAVEVIDRASNQASDTYLNEFVFRYNRRFYRHVSFEALLGLATHQAPTGYWDIIKRNNPRKSAGRPHVPRLLHIDEPESTG